MTALNIRIHESDNDFVVALDGDDADQISTAGASLVAIVPHQFLSAANGFIRINPEAATYLTAWLHAIKSTHRAAKVVWFSIAADA